MTMVKQYDNKRQKNKNEASNSRRCDITAQHHVHTVPNDKHTPVSIAQFVFYFIVV